MFSVFVFLIILQRVVESNTRGFFRIAANLCDTEEFEPLCTSYQHEEVGKIIEIQLLPTMYSQISRVVHVCSIFQLNFHSTSMPHISIEQ